MARVILAIANSSTTRAGRLLSSAIGRGTALGSTLNAPRCAAPGVVMFAASCFMGEEVSALAADSELICESRATIAAALSDFVCSCDVAGCAALAAPLAGCLGWGFLS